MKILIFSLGVVIAATHCFSHAQAKVDNTLTETFNHIYAEQLGNLKSCNQLRKGETKFCSSKLRNDGNAPYILVPDKPRAIVVLFHGLSDSPFFVRSIAEFLQDNQFTVVAPLTPGHGKLDADFDMQDAFLSDRWMAHVDEIMQMSASENLPVFAGGFSTGGALATWYSLQNQQQINGLLLFSGALQLTSSAENMSKIWGIKTLAKWLDGAYETEGPNPYKYPKVASYAGLALMDLIFEIRNFVNANITDLDIFAAHSMADKTTLFEGIKALTEEVSGNHTFFTIDEEYALCHADLPLSQNQINKMKFKRSEVNELEECAVPMANPLHSQMLKTLLFFLESQLDN